MKRIVMLIASMVALVIGSYGQATAVGSTVDNFKLQDVDGVSRSLSDLTGKNGSVLVFLSIQCPVVKGYNERIDQISSEYRAKGINFIGINANATESAGAVRKHATEHYKFPVLIDKANVLADKLGASVTPEIFYLDPKGVLLYHGAIDNDRSGKNATEQYARAAFDATLAGKRIARTSANAFGCSIKRVGE